VRALRACVRAQESVGVRQGGRGDTWLWAAVPQPTRWRPPVAALRQALTLSVSITATISSCFTSAPSLATSLIREPSVMLSPMPGTLDTKSLCRRRLAVKKVLHRRRDMAVRCGWLWGKGADCCSWQRGEAG
jgi:hypothetical protein